MTRLASTAKAGFFPTPERVTQRIARFVVPSPSGGRLLDPCCGRGVAAQHLADAWRLDAYGIEIDAERALEASSRLQHVLHLDYVSARAPHHSFQAILCNPPYDFAEGESRRTEYQFLRDTTKWLQPGGLLVYIIPQYRVDARMAGFLTTAYESIRTYRFPDPEFEPFRQAVVFAIAKQEPTRNEASAVQLLQQCRGSLPILPEFPSNGDQYHLPVLAEGNPSASSGQRFFFRGTEIDPPQALAEALAAGAWRTPEWTEWLQPRPELATFRPLMPLKKGHLAMLIAAGMLQNLRLDSPDGREHLLVKGRTYKVQEAVDSDDEHEVVTRDRFVTEIVALDLETGASSRVAEPAALAAFVEKWREALAAQVMRNFAPLYSFDLDGEGSRVQETLARLSKHRHLPGRQVTGLFPAQKHVAVALWKQLRRSRSAICIGEPGVGKTTIGSAVSELMRECDGDARPSLVMCPPHVVSKWVRELQQIVPMAFAMPLYRLSDVGRFVTQVGRLAPGTPSFAVLSREMAKLGSGWEPAYVIRKRYARVRVSERESVVDQEQVFSCPRCGYPVYEMEGGHEVALVRRAAYFDERKRRCSQCREPLFQMVHLRPAKPEDDARLVNAEARPATLRYPIAEFIARRHRGLFKLLLCDEAHQLKGQSTDQGYALGALVRACDKTLALTGTIYGGKATSIFFLLHRLSPTVRSQFRWAEAQRWVERFGILERVTKRTEGDDGYGAYSGKHRLQTYVRELPGASPELASLLLDCSAFVNLSDLGFDLPTYQEYPHEIEMSKAQRAAYDGLERALKEELRERLKLGDRSLLAAYLQSLLAYPNACFREEVVEDQAGNVVARAPALGGKGAPGGGEADPPKDDLFPKEKWLVELAKREREAGRRVLVLCRQTGRRDITGRLVRILERAGLRADVLTASVGTQVREEWLRRRVGKGMLDVLVVNPRLIETGLDLVAFQTTVWFEIEFSLFTLTQASRRTWRPGQSQKVAVHFVVYRDTMEHRAASLVGQKLAAAQLLYGDAAEGALVQQSDSGRGFLADLTRSLIEQSDIADLTTLFHRVSSVGGDGCGSNQFIGSAPSSEAMDAAALAAGMDAAAGESSFFQVPASTLQMALF